MRGGRETFTGDSTPDIQMPGCSHGDRGRMKLEWWMGHQGRCGWVIPLQDGRKQRERTGD